MDGWLDSLGSLGSSEVLLLSGSSEEEVCSSEDSVVSDSSDDSELLLGSSELGVSDSSELLLGCALDELLDGVDLDEDFLTAWSIVFSEEVSAPTTEYSLTPLTVELFTVSGMSQSEPSAPAPDIM